jgi:hypothetical protein
MLIIFKPSQDLELVNLYKGIEYTEENIWFYERRWVEKQFLA